MKRLFIANLMLATALTTALAGKRTIDISGNNTDKDYKQYSTAINLAAGDTVDVMMARYCNFS